MSDPSKNGEIYEDQVGYLIAHWGMTREEAEAELDKIEGPDEMGPSKPSQKMQNSEIYEDQVGYLIAHWGMTREQAEAEVDKFESKISPPEQVNTQKQ